MQPESLSPDDAAAQGLRAEADAWRAGCLDARQARAFEQAMAADPRLAHHAHYGRRLAQALEPLPELARRRAPRPARTRQLRWPRVLGTGMAAAAFAALGFGLLPVLSQNAAGTSQQTALQHARLNPQMADAVQNLDFYEWLAAHPNALPQAGSHGGTA